MSKTHDIIQAAEDALVAALKELPADEKHAIIRRIRGRLGGMVTSEKKTAAARANSATAGRKAGSTLTPEHKQKLREAALRNSAKNKTP